MQRAGTALFSSFTALACACALEPRGLGEHVETDSDPTRSGDASVEIDPEADAAPILSVSCLGELDLGSALGEGVYVGSTSSAADHASPPCAYASDAPDVGMRWTSPRASNYHFDTIGSAFDTVLHAYAADCRGLPLACNDQVRPDRNASGFRLFVEEGDSIVLVVDGYQSASGDFVLNILDSPPDAEAGACDDGVDNDRDADTDCNDYECRAAPGCTA